MDPRLLHRQAGESQSILAQERLGPAVGIDGLPREAGEVGHVALRLEHPGLLIRRNVTHVARGCQGPVIEGHRLRIAEGVPSAVPGDAGVGPGTPVVAGLEEVG